MNTLATVDVITFKVLMLIIQMEKNTVFDSLLVCYQSILMHLLNSYTLYESNVSFWHFHGKANDVEFYMTVF